MMALFASAMSPPRMSVAATRARATTSERRIVFSARRGNPRQEVQERRAPRVLRRQLLSHRLLVRHRERVEYPAAVAKTMLAFLR
jgi:hypothetical protein